MGMGIKCVEKQQNGFNKQIMKRWDKQGWRCNEAEDDQNEICCLANLL